MNVRSLVPVVACSAAFAAGLALGAGLADRNLTRERARVDTCMRGWEATAATTARAVQELARVRDEDAAVPPCSEYP